MLLIALANLADLASFLLAASVLPISGESNPLMRDLYVALGPVGPALLKLAGVSAILAIGSRVRPSPMKAVAVGIVVVLPLLGAATNLYAAWRLCVSAGDVLLFHRPTTWANFKRDPFGTTMTALIHLTTRSRFNHAALDIGDGLMVEVTSKGVAVNPIVSSDEITAVGALELSEIKEPYLCTKGYGIACPITYMGNDLEETLAWATGRVGWKYGTLNAFWCGLRSVIPGMAHIKHGRTIICSELVSEALARAGHDWPKDYALVSPGDVAEHFGVPRK